MFVVTGATGHTGSVVAERLLASKQRVRVVVRDAAKARAWERRGAESAVASLDDTRSLSRAFEGADSLYLLIPPDPQTKDFLGRGAKIIASAKEAIEQSEIRHAVFLSSIGAHLDERTGPIRLLHRAEEALGLVGDLRCTFVRAAFLMENLLGFLGIMENQGALPVFGGGVDRPIPMVATRDVGEVAAQALLDPPSVSRVVELAGPADYSFADAAQVFARALGRRVTPHVIPLEAVVKTMMGIGTSEDVAELYREMIERMLERGIRWEGGRALRVRGKVTLDEVARSAVAKAPAAKANAHP